MASANDLFAVSPGATNGKRFSPRVWVVALVVVSLLGISAYWGAEVVRRQGWTYVSESRVENTNFARSVAVDREGATWVTTWTGLAKLGLDGHWSTYDYSGYWGLPSDLVLDEQGRAWVVGDSDLVMLAPTGQWTAYALPESGCGFMTTYAVAVGGDGRVWVGHSCGLSVRSQDGEWASIAIPRSGEYDSVLDLATDPQGRLWVASSAGGLRRLDVDGHWDNYQTSNSELADNVVREIAIDSEGQVWAATDGGLSVLSPNGSWKNFPLGAVSAVAVDGQGRVWVGTWDGLQVMERDGRWTAFSQANSGLVPDGVRSIAFDEHGRAYLGTQEALLIFDQSAAAPPALVQFLLVVRLVLGAVLVTMLLVSARWGVSWFRRWQPRPLPSDAQPVLAGQSARFAPGRLAVWSLAGSLISPVLLVVVVYSAAMVGLDDSGMIVEQMPWLPYVLIALVWVTFLLPVAAAITGLVAFLRLHWGVETKPRLAALGGLLVGTGLTGIVVVPLALALLQ